MLLTRPTADYVLMKLHDISVNIIHIQTLRKKWYKVHNNTSDLDECNRSRLFISTVNTVESMSVFDNYECIQDWTLAYIRCVVL